MPVLCRVGEQHCAVLQAHPHVAGVRPVAGPLGPGIRTTSRPLICAHGPRAFRLGLRRCRCGAHGEGPKMGALLTIPSASHCQAGFLCPPAFCPGDGGGGGAQWARTAQEPRFLLFGGCRNWRSCVPLPSDARIQDLESQFRDFRRAISLGCAHFRSTFEVLLAACCTAWYGRPVRGYVHQQFGLASLV